MASRPSTPRDPAKLRHGHSPLRQVENASHLIESVEAINGRKKREATASQAVTPSKVVTPSQVASSSQASLPNSPVIAFASISGKQHKNREIVSPLAGKSSLVNSETKKPAPPTCNDAVTEQQLGQELAFRPKARQPGLYPSTPRSAVLGQTSCQSSPMSPGAGSLKRSYSEDNISSHNNPLGIFNMAIDQPIDQAGSSRAAAVAAAAAASSSASFVPMATAPEFRPVSSSREVAGPPPPLPLDLPIRRVALTPRRILQTTVPETDMPGPANGGGCQGRVERTLIPGHNFVYRPNPGYDETPPTEREAALDGARETAPPPPSHRGPFPPAPTSNVSHTNSKTWVSEPELLRIAFNRMRERVSHIGAADSPFLPRTKFDFAGFEAEVKIVEANQMLQRIRTMQMDAESRKVAREHAATTRQARALADALANPGDGRSMVLGMQSSFNNPPPATAGGPPPPPPMEQVDWPSLAELKANGDDRQRAGLDRRLPPPRKNTIDTRMLGVVPGAAPAVPAGPETPYGFKQLVGDRWDWIDHAEMKRLKEEPAEEIELDEVHDGLRDLLGEIEDFANETNMPGSGRWAN